MEFKKLSDVEVVAEPTESANVLIEENGVIKKAPKTAVGGNGEWDAVIDLGANAPSYIESPSEITVISGGYANIMSKLNAGEMPNVIVAHEFTYGDTMLASYRPVQIMAYPDGDIYIACLWFVNMGGTRVNHGFSLQLNSNNECVKYQWD